MLTNFFTVAWRNLIRGKGFSFINISGLAVGMATALLILLRYEPRRTDPLIDLRFFKSVPFSAANLTAVCAIAASAGFLFLTTLYLQDVRGFTPLKAGLTLLPMPIMMAICSPISGRILARRGPRVPFVIAGAALTLSTAALSQLSATSGPVFLIATYGLFGAGAGQPALYAVVAMGAVFASAARAPLTSLASVVEMTGDYTLTLPVMRHRILANFTAASEGVTTDVVIDKLVKETPTRVGDLEKDERLKKIFTS